MAIAIFAVFLMTVGTYTTSARVDDLVPGGAAERAGFKPGDVILAINGRPLDSFIELQQRVTDNVGAKMAFLVKRQNAEVELTATPELTEVDDGIGGKAKVGRLGIKQTQAKQDVVHKVYGPIDAIVLGTEKSFGIVRSTFAYLGNVIKGHQSADQLGGPARIADASSKIAKLGLDQLIYFMAFISVSVGMINLFPVPVLDGGHLAFYAIEAIRGKPLSEDTQELAFRVGFGLIMALMLFAFWNDRFILLGWLPGMG